VVDLSNLVKASCAQARSTPCKRSELGADHSNGTESEATLISAMTRTFFLQETVAVKEISMASSHARFFASTLAIATTVLIGVAASVDAQENGVLCRFKGQSFPEGNPAEIWSQRWDRGPGVQQVNDDCEAVLLMEEGALPQWVGTATPPRLHYVRAYAEVGVSDDFNILSGERVVFMEIGGDRISDPGGSMPFMIRASLGRSESGNPDDYDVYFSWVSDDDQGTFVVGPFRQQSDRRLRVRVDWEASTDIDRDFLPDPNGEIVLRIEGQVRFRKSGLIIDQTTPTELRFGSNGAIPSGTYGEVFVRPVGIDTGFFSPKD